MDEDEESYGDREQSQEDPVLSAEQAEALVDKDADSVEEEVRAIRSARAQEALRRIGTKAKANGLDRLTMDEIDAIIAKARQERRRRK